ncbi:MAG: class F sortase, partial [Candidatus Dormibacteria bacterium]
MKRTLRLSAAALAAAASVAACGSAAPLASHSAAPTASARNTGTPGVTASGTPAPLPGGGVIPAHISVPAIGISAPVDPVGETPNGDLASPPDWDSVGWFSPGFRPGAPGHAVLNGHLDTNLESRPTAVFWNLNKLHNGDQGESTGTDGSARHYSV